MMKILKQRGQGGGILYVVPLLGVMLLGCYFIFQSLSRANLSIRYANTKEALLLLSNNSLKTVKNVLAGHQTACFDPTMSLLNLKLTTAPAFQINTTAGLTACFTAQEEGSTEVVKNLESINLEISRLIGGDDLTTASGTIKVNYKYVTKKYTESPQLKLEEARLFRYRVSSMGNFALVFRDSSLQDQIDLQNDAKLRVFGWTYINGNVPLDLDRFAKPSVFTSTEHLTFTDPVLVHAKEMKLPLAVTNINLENFRTTFRYGIQTGELSQMSVFPMAETPAHWSQPIDYQYVYGGAMGYPLPWVNGSRFAHGDDYNVSNQANANIDVFPAVGVITSLNLTCGITASFTRGDAKPMILYKAGHNVTLKFDGAGSQSFCGMVAADTLTLEIPEGQKAILIGSFWVKNLIIKKTSTSSAAGEAVIFNPMQFYQAPDLELAAAGIDRQIITRQLLLQRITIASNFFLPLFRDKTGIVGFHSVPLSSYFDSCSAAGSDLCWKTTVSQFDWNTLYNQANWYKKVLFFVEEGI